VVCRSRRKVLNLLVDGKTQRNGGNDKGHRSEISFKTIYGKKRWKWMWFDLAAPAAIRLYYVQEMILLWSYSPLYSPSQLGQL
jgi:hypothetical protein